MWNDKQHPPQKKDVWGYIVDFLTTVQMFIFLKKISKKNL